MLVWAHGLWGSPNGSKVTAIRESGIEVISPDFSEMELVDRVDSLFDFRTRVLQIFIENLRK